MRLLAIEAVERGFDSELFGTQDQVAYRRIGSPVNDILFCGESLSVSRDRLVVIFDKRLGVFVLSRVMARFQNDCGDSVFVESDDVAVRMNMGGTFVTVRMMLVLASQCFVSRNQM